MTRVLPTARLERRLFADGASLIAGIDEVGRGAWAGPLTVGVALLGAVQLRALPRGLADSKLLSPQQRAVLYEPLRRALVGFSIGHASARECDELGLTAAQGLAASRALGCLCASPDVTIVDGVVDFVGTGEVMTLAGADRSSRVVAAASVLAKVTRDALMVQLAQSHRAYGFERNKGYISAEHRRAVRDHGLSPLHRASWSVRAANEWD